MNILSGFDPLREKWNAHALPHLDGAPAVDASGAVILPTSIGAMTISLTACGARLLLGPARKNDYGLLVDAAAPLTAQVASTETETTIRNDAHELNIDHQTLAITLKREGAPAVRSATDGHFVRDYRLPPFAKVKNGWIAHFDLDSADRMYGLGEKWGPLNKRGQLIQSYNHDALGVNTEASYKNAPFAWSPKGWGVFCHTPAPVTHGVGFPTWSQRAYGVHVEDETLDLFLITGSDGAELISSYTALTGRAPAPPRWSLGVIASKAYYRDSEELLTTAREIRARQMPCDTITLDGRAWLDTETRFSFDWDASRYPDPAATLRQLKEMNFKVCVWEYPLVSVKNPLFEEFDRKGWFLKRTDADETYLYSWDREPFGEVLTPLPDSGLVDFTHPDAYAYWRDRHKELFDIGVDMIKADFGEQVPDEVRAHNGDTGRTLHNVYAYLYNKCVYEAAERYCASGPFLFSRASWTGCQRFPSQWGGDPQADWEGFAASIRGGLSWGLTGAPFYATDIGGFYGDKRDPVLYVRWLQTGIFSAHLRLHGIGAREPWTYGPEAEAAAMAALKLRYRLLPYIEKTVATAAQSGLPAKRAMVLALPKEKQAWGFEEQFFFGEDLLVAPCFQANGAVELYLPRGDWRRFPDGDDVIKGGETLSLTLGLDEMAVFARADAKITLGPDIEYTEETRL